MKNFTLFTVLFFLFSCTNKPKPVEDNSIKGRYSMNLTNVEAPGFEKGKINKERSTYEDDLLTIDWEYNKTQLGFDLTNKSDGTLRIIWDEAAYIDIRGKTSRVFHKGIKYTNREESQPPTSIYKNSKLSDLVAPVDYVSYTSGQYGGWSSKPLIFLANTSSYSMSDKFDELLLNKEIRVVLPIKHKDDTLEYIFTFAIDFIEHKPKKQ